VTVDLPADDATAGAAACADVVTASLSQVDGGVIAVGHSLGGLTIPLVAERRLVDRLVFVCGAIPEPGRSHFEVKAEEAEESISDGAASVWEQPGDFHLTPRELARELWYHDCRPDLQDWALDRLRPQSRAPHREQCPLVRWPSVPTSVINTSDDRCIALPIAVRTSRRTLGLEPIVLPGGHCPFLSRPAELADLLGSLAAASG
jgi:pimeloyl-ACP methyl ester carboxylesterase